MSQILDADLVARFRSVRLLSLDLDGTLTDGGLYYADDGSELRKFFVQDGFGILLVKEAGIEVCLITMSDTPAIRKRIDRLKIRRSEEHTSELQSLMRRSYAVFCLQNTIILTYCNINRTTHKK